MFRKMTLGLIAAASLTIAAAAPASAGGFYHGHHPGAMVWAMAGVPLSASASAASMSTPASTAACNNAWSKPAAACACAP